MRFRCYLSVVLSLISPGFVPCSLALYKHMLSDLVKRLSTFASFTLSTSVPMFLVVLIFFIAWIERDMYVLGGLFPYTKESVNWLIDINSCSVYFVIHVVSLHLANIKKNFDCRAKTHRNPKCRDFTKFWQITHQLNSLGLFSPLKNFQYDNFSETGWVP